MVHDNQFGELEGLTKQTCEKNSQWVKFILLLKSAVKANALPKKVFKFYLNIIIKPTFLSHETSAPYCDFYTPLSVGGKIQWHDELLAICSREKHEQIIPCDVLILIICCLKYPCFPVWPTRAGHTGLNK